MTKPHPLLDDSEYFRSGVNPVATIDQAHIEEVALAAMNLPSVQAVRRRCDAYWRLALEPDWDTPTEAMFAEAMVEYAYNYALKAACSDASYPRIGEIFLPAHDAFGPAVPGARIGGPNPDNVYRLVGIEHGSSYELHGRTKAAEAPSNTIYSLVSNYGTSDTVAAIETPEITCASDGSFMLTIDANPAHGRLNHLQTQPGTVFLFIRDSLGDWSTQAPVWLRLRRMTPPSAPPLTLAQVGERAAKAMFDMLPLYYWYQRTCQNPVNRLSIPNFGAQSGGPLSQVGASCGVHLADDEALIAKVRTGGAAYHSLVAHDMCFRTIDPDRLTSSFNRSQAQVNPDGTVTYVVARRDPGIANWIDMGGLPRIILIQRWQLLPPGEPDIGVEMQVVKWDHVDRHLPDDILRIGPIERAAQQAARTADYARRWHP